MGRRLSLGGYDAYRTWLVIEANPLILSFCERPTYVDGLRSEVVDFWVQLSGALHGEFWFVESATREELGRNQQPVRFGQSLLSRWWITQQLAQHPSAAL
jgi:hypothetical protein